MKKLLTKILAPIAITTVLAPSISCLSSCSHADIQKITLSVRPRYICPGQTVQVHASLEPENAKLGDLVWEIDSPILGFTISNSGKVTAPKTFTCKDPLTLTVTATYVKNPEISASIGILIVESDENMLLGFVDDKIEHLDRSGENIISTKIIKNEVEFDEFTTIYETEEPINVFAGRSTEFINFTPIFKPGYNSRMSFHISHPDDEKHHCIDWNDDYTDGDWTTTIPNFIPLSPAYRTDEIHVTFYSAPTVKMIIRLNIYQQPINTSPGVFTYVPNEEIEGADKHSITYNGLGSYASSFLCPTVSSEGEKEYHMGDIYCYRKPYEYLNFDRIEFNTNDQDPRIKGLFKTIELSGIEEKSSLPWFPTGLYPAYKLSIDYTVDCTKIVPEWEYEPMYIGTLFAYDTLIMSESVCRLDFWIQWEEA